MIYKGKKILLMGLGKFAKGSGISAAEFLAKQKADLTITDVKNKKQLAKNLQPLKKYKNIKYVLGDHKETDFANADWVIRNPDVPPSNKYLEIARKNNIPIDNDVTLFFREYGVKDVVGVTGTRGKSTTTSLIYAMCKSQYFNAKLGGNIGESPLRFLQGLKAKNGPVVLELSNFLLSDLDTVKMSPHVAVWTNLYPDHLNKYPSINEYIVDKEKIFKYQKKDDVAVLNWDNEVTREVGLKLKNKVYFFSLKEKMIEGAYIKDEYFVFSDEGVETKVCKVTATPLLGVHNQANILAAICAAHGFGIKWSAIKFAISEFKGVPNRLEIIKKIKGVTFVNDCTATSPQATLAALKSFEQRKVILISGGNSKGFPLDELGEEISKSAKVLIMVPGNANEEILKNVKEKELPIISVKTLKEAVKKAYKMAIKGDYIILSPGLTWLPKQNEFARGDEFRKIVKSIKG